MSENDTSFWTEQVHASELSPNEKKLRDKFVDEYLLDFDQTGAAMRIGFSISFADTYAQKFMGEPYVRQRIQERQLKDAEDPRSEAEADRRRIRAALLREAHYNGPGSSHAARVAALGKLGNYRDMDGAVKQEVTHRGGVMMVPAIASLEEWQKVATGSQDALQKDTQL